MEPWTVPQKGPKVADGTGTRVLYSLHWMLPMQALKILGADPNIFACSWAKGSRSHRGSCSSSRKLSPHLQTFFPVCRLISTIVRVESDGCDSLPYYVALPLCNMASIQNILYLPVSSSQTNLGSTALGEAQNLINPL